MKTILWKDVFLCHFPDLKEIRKSENINIPNEYNDLVKKMSTVVAIYCSIIGIFLGISITNLYILLSEL